MGTPSTRTRDRDPPERAPIGRQHAVRVKCLSLVLVSVIYITRGLVETLLRFAAESDPDRVTVPLSVTPASELPAADLAGETPVFTHFYMPNAGDALNAVFGVDLKTPAAQTPGVFVSHPLGELKVTRRDDLREVVFLAVPPWSEESFRAFDRKGRGQELSVLDVEPPEESHLVE